MEFIYEAAGGEGGVAALATALTSALEKHSRVLWLVCGGSSIVVAVRVMRMLPDELTAKLHIMLTDERYGAVGHADSNYYQLRQAGFDPKQATFIPTLTNNVSLEATATDYGTIFDAESSAAGYIIAQFGIGPDGHIAGILPNSPAASSQALCVGYQAGAFERITLTFPALKKIDAAYAYAYGEPKVAALTKLKNELVDLLDQPSQILRAIPEAYVYNNCIA